MSAKKSLVFRFFFVMSLLFFLLATNRAVLSDLHAGAGTSGLRFLSLGIGARAIGMGGAFTGLADDASAGYWNPGGLAQIEGMEVLTMYDSWLEGMSHIYLGLNKKLESGEVIGAQVNYFSSGDIPMSDSSGNRTGSTSANDLGVGLSYAMQANDALLVGANLKMIKESLGNDDSGSGYGVDGGLLYRTQNYINLGFTVQNLSSGVKMKNETLPMPLTVRAGVSYSMIGNGTPMVLNGDLATIDGVLAMSAGGEYLYNTMAFRLGLTNTNAGMRPSLGFGLNQNNVLIDASMSMYGDFGSTFKVSLIGKFGGAAVLKEQSGGSRTKSKAYEVNKLKEDLRKAMAFEDYTKAKEIKAKIAELENK